MKFLNSNRSKNLTEKVTIALCLLTLLVMGTGRALASNLYNDYAGPGTSVNDPTVIKAAPTKAAAAKTAAAKTAATKLAPSKVASNKLAQTKIVRQAKAPLKRVAKRTAHMVRSAPEPLELTPEQKRARNLAKRHALHHSIDNEIQDLTSDLEQSPNDAAHTAGHSHQTAAKALAPNQSNNSRQQKPTLLIAQNDDTTTTPPKRQGLTYLRVAGPQDTYAMTVPPTSANTLLSNPADSNDKSQSDPAAPLTNTTTTQVVDTEKAESSSPYSGGVDFTAGHDNNVDPNKMGMTSAYYAITPTLNLKKGGWSAQFTGTWQDYTDQAVSDTNKSSEAHIQGAYEGNITDWIKSTSTLEGVYHNSMMPNDVSGYTVEGTDPGLSNLYYETKFTEALDFKFNSVLSSQIGATFNHREATSIASDYAADILDPLFYTGSFNDYKGFGSVTAEAGDNVEFVLRPSIDSKVYTSRDARQSDGSASGNLLTAPNRDLLTSEVAMDINFKFLGSTIGPTGVIGEVSDEALGGENNSYYGGGIKGDIMLVPDWKLVISPSLLYKHIQYDNWTSSLSSDPGSTRADDDVEVAVKAKVMFTKNFGIGANYANSHYTSNWMYSGVNFNEEVYSTTASFSF